MTSYGLRRLVLPRLGAVFANLSCMATATKQSKSKKRRQPGRRGAARTKPSGRSWHGQETRPGRAGSETAEEAADRAEGNARLSAGQAVRRAARADGRGVHSGTVPRRRPSARDNAENLEEKRRAAVEEAAAKPSRRAGHAKL